MHSIPRLKLLLALCLILITSCGTRSFAVETDRDPEFTAAVKQAHDTLDVFFRGHFSPSPTLKFSGLRVRFNKSNDNSFEYQWTEFVDYYAGVFTVKLLDGTTLDRGLHEGRSIEVLENDIVDWMIVEKDGTFTGGYTVLLAYERMTPEQRRRFLEVTGYVIR